MKTQEQVYVMTVPNGVKTPKALNMNNPVQAEGAARGRENRRQNPPPNPRQRGIGNSVGVQPLPASCCAPTEHSAALLRSAALARYIVTPSCAFGLHGVIHITHLRCVSNLKNTALFNNI